MAVITVIGMYQGSVPTLASTYIGDSDGDGDKICDNGGSISASFTIDDQSAYQNINTISFDAYVPDGGSLAYSWSVSPSGESSVSGSDSKASSKSAPAEGGEQTYTEENIEINVGSVTVATGQPVNVSVTFPDGAIVSKGGQITMITSEAGVPSDVNNIALTVNGSSNNPYYISKDQLAGSTLTITATPDKAYRSVNCDGISGNGDNTFTVPSDLTVGAHTYNFSPSVNPASQSICVYDANIDPYTYGGNPTITVYNGLSSGEVMSVSDYSVAYDSNVNAGTHTASITIGSGLLTFTKDYVINPKDFVESDFSSATWTIDSATGKATASVFTSADYDATAVLVKSNPGSNIYNIVVRGKGNYSGTVNLSNVPVPTSGGSGSAVNINDVFTAEITSDIEYDGTAKNPEPIIKGTDGTVLSGMFGDDGFLTLSWSNCTDATDEAKCTITGNPAKGYTGSMDVFFTIEPKDLSGATVTLDIPSDGSNYYAVSTGSRIEPNATVSVAGRTLIEGTDYSISYSNNVNISKNALVTIDGIGNYTGSKDVKFEIIANVEQDVSIKLGSSAKTKVVNGNAATTYQTAYTGSAVEPAVKIYSGNTEISAKSITYSDNVDAGTAKVTIEFDGKYAGGSGTKTITATYTITPLSIVISTITLSKTNYDYTGNPVTVSGTVVKNTNTLTEGVDYDITYSVANPTNAGTYTATFTGKGNYTGSNTADFRIRPVSMVDVTVSDLAASYPYTGKEIKPAVTVKLGDIVITNGYKVEYSNNINCGTATVVIKADSTQNGNFTGQITKTFEITKKNMGELKYILNGNVLTVTGNRATSSYSTVYDRTNKTISGLVVQDPVSGRTLVRGTDYNVSYSNNYNAGENTAEMRISASASGNYSDLTPITITFTIKPRDINNSLINVSNYTVGATPNAQGEILPTFSIKDNGNSSLKLKSLELGKDYTVSAKTECKTAGDQTCTITGKGNYTGTRDVDYQIGQSIDNAEIVLYSPWDESIEIGRFEANNGNTKTMSYIGEREPVVKIDFGSGNIKTLEEVGITRSDAVSSYIGALGDVYNSYDQQNTVSFTLDATNSSVYYGTRTLTYVIQKLSLGSATVVDVDTISPADDFKYNYSGSSFDIKPSGDASVGAGKVYLMVQGMIVDPSDYTVQVNGVTATSFGPAAKTYTVKFAAANNTTKNYRDYKEQTYEIVRGNFAASMTIVGGSSFSYTGSPIEPEVVLKDSRGNTLVKDQDYTLTYINNTEISSTTSAGKATVRADGMGNFLGAVLTADFMITQVDISAATVTAQPVEYTSDGMTVDLDEIGFTVKANGEILTLGSDYTAVVAPITAADIGLAKNNRGVKVTITGNGVKYAGTKDVYVDLKANLATLFTGVIDGKDLSTPVSISDWEVLTEQGVTVANSVSTALPKDANLYTVTKSAILPGEQKLTISGANGAYNNIVLSVKVKADLSGAGITVTLDKKVYDYTGRAVNPAPLVKYDGNTIPSTLYDIVNDDNVDVGVDKTLTVKPKTDSPFLIGEKSVSYDIVYNLSNAEIALSPDSYVYDGSEKKPAVTVTVNGNTVPSGYYTVTYANNVNVGTATVTVTAKSEPTTPAKGLKTKTFVISAINTLGVEAVYTDAPVGETGKSVQMIYTGDEIKPAVTVTRDDKVLRLNDDYTVEYKNNVNVTTSTDKARTIITLKGNYTGIINLDFEILKKSIDTSDVTVNVDPVFFTGDQLKPAKPVYTVSYNGRTLVEGIDYVYKDVTYDNQALYGQNAAKLKIEGIGNFKDIKEVNYDIKTLDISSQNSGVKIESTSEYNGTNQFGNVSSNVKLYYDNVELSSDYYKVEVAGSVTGNDMTDAGTYGIVITGLGGFSGTRQTTYTIEPARIANDKGVLNTNRFSASLSTDAYEYLNGSPVMPGDDYLTVNDLNCNHTQKTLTKDVDYTVTYNNNQASASKDDENGPRLIITGIGNYQGTYEIPFSIGTKLTNANIEYVINPIDPDATYTYDGKSHVPTITRLSYTGDATPVELVEGVDYRIKSLPEDDVNAGITTIVVEGIGAYYGDIDVNYVIQPKTTVPKDIRVVLPNTSKDSRGYYATYTGTNIEPDVVVYDDAISRTKPIDPRFYTVIYGNNHDVSPSNVDGWAVVEIQLNTNYANGGDVNPVYFEIRGRAMGGMSLTIDEPTVPYAEDSDCAPVETVMYDDGSAAPIVLRKDYDYEVEYQYYGFNPDDPTNCENPTNLPVAGPAKIIARGLGNYTGEKSITYVIYGDLSEIPDDAIADQLYTGEQIVPDITGIFCGGRYLKPEDVRLSTTSADGYTESGILYIDANNSYYTNRKQLGFNVVFDASSIQVDMPNGTNYIYTGKPIEPNFVITTNDGAAVPDEAITISYKNVAKDNADHTNVGTVTATIKVVVGAKELTVNKNFEIKPIDIGNDAYVKSFIVETNYYDGDRIDPYLELRKKSDSEKLVLDRDYFITNHGDSNGNKINPTTDGNPGVIVVTAKPGSNYTGTRTLEYTIKSPNLTGLKTNTSTDTTADISWSRISYATGYQVELPNGQVVTVPGSGNNTYKVTGLIPSSANVVRVRTYVTVNGTTYYGDYSTLSITTSMAKAEGTGTSTASRTATVSWDNSSAIAQNIIGYKIYRSNTKNGAYSLVAIVPRTRAYYTDGQLTSGTTYYYKIRAYKYDGGYVDSPESDVIAITVK